MVDHYHPKTIIKLGDFPPPRGGVTIFNENLYNFLIKKRIDFLFFIFRENELGREKVVSIKAHNLRDLFLLIIKSHLLLFADHAFQGKYKICLSLKHRVRFFLKAILISKWLRKEKCYSALCDDLGLSQIIFIYLKLLGYSIDIHTYLHGAGIIEKYDKELALYKKLTNLSSTYIVASKFMADVYNEKKDKIDDVRICPPHCCQKEYF